MRYLIIALAFVLLPCQAQAGLDSAAQSQRPPAISQAPGSDPANGQPSGNTTSQTIAKPKSKLKLPTPNLAKVKQLDAQMKALKPKLESINGLPADQQYKIDQMHDLLMKMIAVMNSLVNKMEEQSTQ